ncbi:MAG TPA: Lrp/AsnC family transcriptional regulator [Deltaproteobacteria bacterium]|nr:Lrp/AsnC family transcriptional regulator [Deltaproteobacteria bacterium]
MDSIDKKILNLVNTAFPIQQRPYLHVARKLDLPEDEVIRRMDALKQEGVIRRIGAIIDPKRLGWYSTLCAAEIPQDKIEDYVRAVNAYQEVTHNYLRQGSPNCWFTLITPESKRAEEIISELRTALGVDIQNLPARRTFKIRVHFDLE